MRPVRRRPVEAGQNAGERTREAGDAVGDHAEAEAGKPRGVAVGVESERRHLGRGAGDDMGERSAGRRAG